MRDIRTEGNFVVQGDFTVNEAPGQAYVPFDQMGFEDLRLHFEHHSQLAREERRRINNIAFKLFGIALAVATVLSIWYFFAEKTDLAMFIVGLIGVGLPVFLAIKTGESQSDFEIRQLNTIRHLSHLIRERTPR